MKDSKSIIKKYRNLFVSMMLIISGAVIVIQVITPQIDEIQVKDAEIKNATKKVEALKITIQVLASLSDDDLNKYFDLTQSALPQVKDVLSIYNELSSAAQKNDAILGDLRINLGSVYNKDKSKEIEKVKPDTNYGSSVLSFEVNVDGSTESLRAFSQSLYKSTPVVEIKAINIRNDTGVFKASFFYNPLTVTTADTDIAAKDFSADEKKLLAALEEWVENSKIDSSNQPNSQASISPSPTITVSPAAN